MKKLILTIIVLHFYIHLKAQNDYENVNFLGLFNDSAVVAETQYGIRYQACWGWADILTGKEYGIIGSTAGTYIIEVTDPTNPVKRDYIPHRQDDHIWHEYKTYKNYLYIISDDGGPNSFQIADLSYLPDSVSVVYDSTDIFLHAHTLFIDGDKLYVGKASSVRDYSSMNVYSLSNPLHPTLLRRLDQDYPFINSVHDMFVSNDTVFASCGYQGLYIFKYDELANQFLLLGSLEDGFNIYNHSSVLSPDQKTLYVCEEVPEGRPFKIVDVSGINTPALDSTFYSNIGATPHNPLVKNNMLIVAYYQDGVYLYDISNPKIPMQIGYFDTYPDNTPGSYLQPAYSGSWSAYADLPSGILLAGDTKYGLFCLDISLINKIKETSKNELEIFPIPASKHLKINNVKNSTVQLLDLNGRECWISKNISENLQIDISGFKQGVYVLKITGKDRMISKIVVIE